MSAIWRNVHKLGIMSSAAFAAAAVIPMTALADGGGTTPPGFMMTWDASNDALNPDTYNPSEFATTPTAYGTWQLGGPAGDRERTGWRYLGGQSNLAWTLTWDCVVNEDPFVDATINVTNNSNAFQTFWVYMPLNIVPSVVPSSIMDGSVSAAIADADFAGGATMLATAADPVYRAYIDGNQVGGATNLWNPGYNLNAPQFGGMSDSTNFSGLNGPAALNQIAVALRFDLSPGDSASVTGIFNIVAVPGPGGLALATVAAMFGVRRRRR